MLRAAYPVKETSQKRQDWAGCSSFCETWAQFHPNPLQGWALRNDNLPLSRAEDAAAAGPTLTVGPRSIDGTDTSIKTSSSRRPPIHRGACGGVAEVECRVYEEPLEGDGTGSCR